MLADTGIRDKDIEAPMFCPNGFQKLDASACMAELILPNIVTELSSVSWFLPVITTVAP